MELIKDYLEYLMSHLSTKWLSFFVILKTCITLSGKTQLFNVQKRYTTTSL